MKHYDDRDIMTLDEIGNYYSNHIAAMTAENLNSKTDIAAELAHRDLIIDQLQAEVERLRNTSKQCSYPIWCDYVSELEQERDQLKDKLSNLSDVCDAVFEWVDSVPAETILPTMPGFDRDWADQLRQQAKEAYREDCSIC